MRVAEEVVNQREDPCKKCASSLAFSRSHSDIKIDSCRGNERQKESDYFAHVFTRCASRKLWCNVYTFETSLGVSYPPRTLRASIPMTQKKSLAAAEVVGDVHKEPYQS